MAGTFEGKSVIVTGVASGLGTALAREFAAEGAQVVGCDVNDEQGAEAMAGIGIYRHADVSKESDVAALVDYAVDRLGRLDVMVNNAAVQVEERLADTSEEQLDKVIAVNLKGPFFGCKHAIRAMLVAGGGAIVNVSSVAGLAGDPMLAAYGATKGGVLALTKAAAITYGRDNIRVNAVCPGDIQTPLVERYFAAAEDPAALRAQAEAEYPIGRIGQPREIARSVLFLASDDASFVTGEALVVDGGVLSEIY